MTLKIDKGPALRDRTTLRLGGNTLAEVRAEALSDWEQLPEELARLGGSPLVLGWGSNILACDQDLPLVVVSPSDDLSPCECGTHDAADGPRALIRCGASVRLPLLLAWTAAQGHAGLEGMAGIPGTVGGAIAMNAGSYGCEIGQTLHRVRIFSPDTGLVWVECAGFEYGYRSFTFTGAIGKAPYRVILEAEFALKQGDPDALRSIMKDCIARKTATQPVREASAGCVFKNPEGASAGKLLDDAGLKGMRRGGMAFSSLHANFLVNLGGGTSEQALELMDLGRVEVGNRFGYELHTEVEVVGCP